MKLLKASSDFMWQEFLLTWSPVEKQLDLAQGTEMNQSMEQGQLQILTAQNQKLWIENSTACKLFLLAT